MIRLLYFCKSALLHLIRRLQRISLLFLLTYFCLFFLLSILQMIPHIQSFGKCHHDRHKTVPWFRKQNKYHNKCCQHGKCFQRMNPPPVKISRSFFLFSSLSILFFPRFPCPALFLAVCLKLLFLLFQLMQIPPDIGRFQLRLFSLFINLPALLSIFLFQFFFPLF